MGACNSDEGHATVDVVNCWGLVYGMNVEHDYWDRKAARLLPAQDWDLNKGLPQDGLIWRVKIPENILNFLVTTGNNVDWREYPGTGQMICRMMASRYPTDQWVYTTANNATGEIYIIKKTSEN